MTCSIQHMCAARLQDLFFDGAPRTCALTREHLGCRSQASSCHCAGEAGSGAWQRKQRSRGDTRSSPRVVHVSLHSWRVGLSASEACTQVLATVHACMHACMQACLQPGIHADHVDRRACAGVLARVCAGCMGGRVGPGIYMQACCAWKLAKCKPAAV